MATIWPSPSPSSLPSPFSSFSPSSPSSSMPKMTTKSTTFFEGGNAPQQIGHSEGIIGQQILISSSTIFPPVNIIRHHPDPFPPSPSPPIPSEPVFSPILSPSWFDLANHSVDFVPVQEMLSWLLNGPLTLLFVLSGIALNALCVLVFLRFRNTGGTTPIIHYYLISLACWHSALLCNAFVLYCLPTLLWGSVVSTGPYVHLYPPTYTLANATHTGTVWIILALTLDRYLALCMPFKHRMFSKRSRVKRLVVGLSALAIVFSLPRFFEVTTAFECTPAKQIVDDFVNGTMEGGGANGTTVEIVGEGQMEAMDCLAYVQRTGLPQNQLYRTLYHILLGSTFVTILPGVLTFVLTLRITMALSEAQRRRKRLSHCEPMRSSETKTTTVTVTEKESHSGGGGKEMENNSSGGGGGGGTIGGIGYGNEKHQYRTMLLGAGMATSKKASCLRKKEHRANVMLVVVIVKFLISDILPTVLDVFETFIGNEAFMSSPVATLWVDFSNLLLVLNCSTNFWVFIFYVRGFRQRCARLLAISLRLSPSPVPLTTDGNESAFNGSCFASPRPSTTPVMVNGGMMAAAPGGPAYRPRGSTGEYTELAKNAMLNSSSAAPILASRDASLQSLHRLNGGSGSFSSTVLPGINRQQSPKGSRGGSPPGEQNFGNGGLPMEANGKMGPTNNFMRSKRACSLGVAQHRASIGVTITPPQGNIGGGNGGMALATVNGGLHYGHLKFAC